MHTIQSCHLIHRIRLDYFCQSDLTLHRSLIISTVSRWHWLFSYLANCITNEQRHLTWNTLVAGFKVWRQISRTWLVAMELCHLELTALSSTAQSIYLSHDVTGTANVPVVAAHTSTESHSAVQRWPHHYHVTVGTRRLEQLKLAVLTQLCRSICNNVYRIIIDSLAKSKAFHISTNYLFSIVILRNS